MNTVTTLFQAIERGDRGAVESLLDLQPTLASATSTRGESAVVFASYRAQNDLLALLVERRAILDFFECCIAGVPSAIREMVDADPAVPGSWCRDGFTGLHFAAFFGRQEVARILLEAGADMSAVSRNALGVQPLHAALASKHASVAALLIDRGAPVNTRQTGDGLTPLHYAAAHGLEEIARLLIERGAALDARSNEKKTPLMMAEERGHKQLAPMLGSGGK